MLFNTIVERLLFVIQSYLLIYFIYLLNIYPSLPSDDVWLILSFCLSLGSILIYLYFFVRYFSNEMSRQMLVCIFIQSALNMAFCTLLVVYNHII